MKKLFVMLCAAVALFSCTKEYPVTEEPMASPMTFNLSVSHAEADATKALKSGWEVGDVVYVFFNNIKQKYLKLSYDGTAWTQTECNTEEGGAKFEPSDFSAIDEADRLMTAVYIPYYDVTVTYDDSFGAFFLRDASMEYFYTYFMSAEGAAYTVSGKTVSGTLAMEKPDGFVQFFVPGIDPAEASLYRLREDNLMSVSCAGVLLGGFIEFRFGGDGYCLQGFPYQGGVLFAGYLNTAGTATDYAFQLVKYVSATKACAEGTYEIKGRKTIDEGVVLRFPELTNAAWTYGKWVDMGPAGRWATGNLTDDGGTTKGEANIVAPDEAGKYYAWGETVGYEPNGSGEFAHSFDFANYKLANGAHNKLTKYCRISSYGNEGNTDDLTELTRSDGDCDDAATKNLGSAWRMPTDEECGKLVSTDNFDWSWQDSGYDIKGRLVTCKDTGLSMYLPAAGQGIGISLLALGDYGYYWASTFITDNPFNAYDLSVGSSHRYVFNDIRCYGQSVRPVYAPVPAISFNLGGSYSGLGDEWDTSGGYGGGGNYNGFGDEYKM